MIKLIFKGKLVAYDSMSKTIHCYREDDSMFSIENVPEGKVEATPHATITILPPVDAFEETTIVGNELWSLKIPADGGKFIEKYIIHKSPRCSDCISFVKQIREIKDKLQEIEELWRAKTS
jgi:hypothetical protein